MIPRIEWNEMTRRHSAAISMLIKELKLLGHNDIFEGEILKFKDYYLGKERYFEVMSITKTFVTDTITTSTLELKEITENENEEELSEISGFAE